MAKTKRRKMSKAEARAEAQRRKRRQQIIWAIAGVSIVAVVVVVILIVASGGESTEVVEAQPLRDDVETGVTAEGYPYRGSADAPVTIVEYSDYNCPHCATYNVGSAPQVDDELVATGQVKYVVPPFALWQESIPVVEAAVCAREQDGFWEFHHTLFANQNLYSTVRPPSRGLLRQFAEKSGLDADALAACLDQGRRDFVEAATQIAKVDLGVSGTPSIFVNGVKTQLLQDEPALDTLRNAVQSALNASGQE